VGSDGLLCAAAALALAATAQSALAQGPTFAVGGGLSLGDHRVDMGFGVEHSAGTLLDLQGTVELNDRFAIAVIARTGVLHPGRGATLPRDVAEAGLDARYRPRPWLDVEAGMRVRSYTTPVGRQRWTLPHLGAAGRVPFALQGLQGVVALGLHPFAAVSGLPDPELAISSRVGMQYTRRRLSVELVYALDRYDFARGTVRRRLEQYSSVALRLHVKTAPPLRRAPSPTSGS
jgi:hypothetical protein